MSRQAKKQHAHASSDLRDHYTNYSELFTRMAGMKFLKCCSVAAISLQLSLNLLQTYNVLLSGTNSWRIDNNLAQSVSPRVLALVSVTTANTRLAHALTLNLV